MHFLADRRRTIVGAIAALLVLLGAIAIATRDDDSGTTSLSSAGTTTSTTQSESAEVAETTTTSTSSTTSTSLLAVVATTAKPVAPPTTVPPARGFGAEAWLAYGLTDSTRIVSPDGSGDYELVGTNSSPHWSHDHRLLVVSGHAKRSGTWVIGADRQERQVSLPEGASWPTFTADNTRVLAAVYRGTETGATWTIRSAPVDGGPDKVLRECTCGMNMPTASPDGTTIAFLSGDGVDGKVSLMDADGSNVRDAPGSHDGVFGLDWTPDSQSVVYGVGGDVWMLNVRTGARRQLTNTPASESQPHVSPDGKTIAFRVEGATAAIEVMNLDGSSRRRVIEAPIYTVAW